MVEMDKQKPKKIVNSGPQERKKNPKAQSASTQKMKKKTAGSPQVKRTARPKPAPASKPIPKKRPAKLYLNDQFYQPLSFIKKIGARKALGLDIDSDKIRYAVSLKTKDENQVLAWGVQKFPSEEKDRWKSLQIALENVKAKVYKRGMEVNVSIFNPEINSRQIILPEMKKESDLKQAIYHKNEADLQNFNDKSVWTYEILDRFQSEDMTKLRISIIAAPLEVLEEYLQVFNSMKLEINNLISRPSAIQSAYRRMVFRPDRDLLIDIGYDLTQMCFIKNGRVEYIRNVSIGARNLEVTIRSNTEKIEKSKTGSTGSDADMLSQNPDEVRSRLMNRIKDLKKKQNPVLHTFFSEILRSMAFFQGKDVHQYIERIFVTGYGIRKESLMPYLKTRLSIPLFILTPQFEDRDQRTLEFGEYFSTLGTTLEAAPGANILPQSYKNKAIFKKLNTGLTTFFITVALILVLISSGQYKLIDQKKRMITQAATEYNKLNPIEGKYREVQSLISDVNDKNKELKGYIQSRPPVVEILRLLSNEVPKGIRLEKIDFIRINTGSDQTKFKNDFLFQMDLGGVITTDPLMSDVVLINFVNQLNDLNFFKHIELLNKIKETEPRVTRFTIRVFL